MLFCGEKGLFGIGIAVGCSFGTRLFLHLYTHRKSIFIFNPESFLDVKIDFFFYSETLQIVLMC